jgi:hypothetical protein
MSVVILSACDVAVFEKIVCKNGIQIRHDNLLKI